MHDKVLRLLEFDKVKEQLKTHASSTLGKQKVSDLKPFADFETVLEAQQATDEGVTVLRLKGYAPLRGIRDIRQTVKRAEIGGMLSTEELLDIVSTLHVGKQLKMFIQTLIEDGADLPILAGFCEKISPEIELNREIKRCIDDDGVVVDSASHELSRIRRQLRNSEAQIREKLEAIIRSGKFQKMLSDAIVTLRNDRYVIPVKQEYRHSFGGIVHDQSASGATLFIEPQSVVTVNNRLRELKADEKREVEKILKTLSQRVAQSARELYTNMAMLAELDFIFAKANYAKAIAATKPALNNKNVLTFKQARHPLIAKEAVVPIDVELGCKFTSLVITGPNTGGKTVTLKTIGLLTVMAQAGLHIPVDDGSEAAVFHTVFADIGDEQSIEQNLSTFSSHMTNIIDMLNQIDKNSLVLFDELGAGTDPQEGAALAISILDDVCQRGALVVATTHYSELKAYAYNRNGVMNASVEFDVETLRPTYRLLIGVPGRSNAFDISRKLGLSPTIIERAKEQISRETAQVDNMLASLERAKQETDEELENARRLRKEAESMKAELKKQFSAFQSERKRLYQEAEEKARHIVEQAKREAEEILQELRSYRHKTVKEHQLIDAKKRLEEAAPNLSAGADFGSLQDRAEANEELQPGDEVKVLSLEQKGQIVKKIDDREYLVHVGMMKVNVKANDVEKIRTKESAKPIVSVKPANRSVKSELDLRGKRYEDAQVELERYLDNALLSGFSQVSIIHGKGTGALRKSVQELLKNHPHVKRMRMGGAGEGGSGVTVVELK